MGDNGIPVTMGVIIAAAVLGAMIIAGLVLLPVFLV